MPNGTIETAVLSDRVTHTQQNLVAVQSEIHELRSVMATTDDIRDLARQVGALGAKIETMGRPQWQVMWSGMGVGVSVLIMIGTMAYLPIRDKQTDLMDRLNYIMGTTVTRVEFVRDRELVDRIFGERQRIGQRNSEDIQSLLRQNYSQNAELSKNTQAIGNLESRFSAISNRLAELIRDLQRESRR